MHVSTLSSPRFLKGVFFFSMMQWLAFGVYHDKELSIPKNYTECRLLRCIYSSEYSCVGIRLVNCITNRRNCKFCVEQIPQTADLMPEVQGAYGNFTQTRLEVNFEHVTCITPVGDTT